VRERERAERLYVYRILEGRESLHVYVIHAYTPHIHTDVYVMHAHLRYAQVSKETYTYGKRDLYIRHTKPLAIHILYLRYAHRNRPLLPYK